jgi:hypothetical protein
MNLSAGLELRASGVNIAHMRQKRVFKVALFRCAAGVAPHGTSLAGSLPPAVPMATMVMAGLAADLPIARVCIRSFFHRIDTDLRNSSRWVGAVIGHTSG